jgi:class 3 adenylate cyclase
LSFGVGIHVGDVFEESDGDLMGDGVNIAARLEAIAEPGGICLSEDAYRQVRAYAVKTRAGAMPPPHAVATERPSPRRLSIVVLPSDWAERKKQNPPEPFRGSSE